MFCSVFTDESEPQPDRHHCRHTHTKRGFSVCGWIIDFIVCTHLDILSSTARKHGGWWHVTMDTDWMVLEGWAVTEELRWQGSWQFRSFNRGFSARRRRYTWRPAWSPYMWARSETRAARSRSGRCHAAQRCRNILFPGRRPSHRNLQQQGLRARKERGIHQHGMG